VAKRTRWVEYTMSVLVEIDDEIDEASLGAANDLEWPPLR
jgi:hypothetical protein